MKKRFRKAVGFLLVTACLAGLLSACGGGSGVTKANVDMVQAESLEETTTAPRTPVDIADPNPLTGLEDKNAVGKRPVAVMINNIKAALPQYGVEQAELVFEIPVEENLTRLMAFYSDYENLPDICSVRSCRYYFPAIAAGFDAVYIHWGIDFTMYDYVDGLGLNRYDLDNAYETYDLGLCTRDQERIDAGYAWEHTSAFLGSTLPAALEKEGVDMSVKSYYKGTFFNFNPYEEPIVSEEGSCEKVRIDFGAQTSQFEYDKKSGTYLKFHSKKPHVDAKSGKQYAYTNVIILETVVKNRKDNYHKKVNWKGGEDTVGYYISQGSIRKIHWSKKSEAAKLKLFDDDGNELTLNRGKTYIAFCKKNSATFE